MIRTNSSQNNMHHAYPSDGHTFPHTLPVDLLKEDGNDSCADCKIPLTLDTAWAVLSRGILVCDDCKLVHIDQVNAKPKPVQDGEEKKIPPPVVLPISIRYNWTSGYVNDMKNMGNKLQNKKLLAKTPIWQYVPCGNDGIKLKEHWINIKYDEREQTDKPKIYNNGAFLATQFSRPIPRGHGASPCCAVLKSEEVLYLTTDLDVHHEEIPIHCIETLVVNSKRIGHDNGIMMTYRRNNDANNVALTYLQHESMTTVMDWTCLILYLKCKFYRSKYPSLADPDISKFLNFVVLKESYMPIPGHNLVYVSLTEARLCCFQHHFDNKPLFQIAISSVMNLKACDYLDALAKYFDMEPSKITSYNDWLTAVDQVLKLDKLSELPDDVPKPSIPIKMNGQHNPSKTISEKSVEVDVVTTSVSPASNIPTTSGVVNNIPTTIKNSIKADDTKKSEATCYPPIGPMGEMGKVYRGELPAESIKPPPTKNEISRANYNDLTTSTTATHSQGIKEAICYPPIVGPPDLIKMRNESFPNQAAVRRGEAQELQDLRNGQTVAANLLTNKFLRNNTPAALAAAAQGANMFDPARLTGGLGRFGQDPTLALAAGQYAWNDEVSQNSMMGGLSLGSFPQLRSQLNGFDSAAVRGFPTGAASPYDLHPWAWPGAGARHQQAVELNQSLLGRLTQNATANWPQNLAANGLNAGPEQWMSAANHPYVAAAAAAEIRILAAQQQQQQQAAQQPLSPDLSTAAQFGKLNLEAAGLGNPFSQLNINSAASQPLHKNLSAAAGGNSGLGAQSATLVNEVLSYRWKVLERDLSNVQHRPGAFDLSKAGLDKNSLEHADTCAKELFEHLLNGSIVTALSFVRSFREIFSTSAVNEIRNRYMVGTEAEFLKSTFFNVGREKMNGPEGQVVLQKILTANNGNPAPTSTPTPTMSTAAAPSSIAATINDDTPWPSTLAPSTSDDSSWPRNNYSFSSMNNAAMKSVWGDNTYTTSTRQIGNQDPWSNAVGSSFNRAPSRPPASARQSVSSVSETFATDGSKTSSQSESPHATSPVEMEQFLNAQSIETTYKNIFKNE